MLNRWNDTVAALCTDSLALRAYSSRLLGSDPDLVLHGGGNTSIKVGDTLWVKGSGSDLAKVTPADFTPVHLDGARALLAHGQMTNDAMMSALAPLIREPGRPKPSIETLLHAALPFDFVEHTHADAILAVTNTVNGEAIAQRVFGTRAPCAPFRQSGFELAKACMDTYDREHRPDTVGLILLQHGVFAFGSNARESYGHMLDLVARAERYLQDRSAWRLPVNEESPRWAPAEVARLRADVCRTAGFPLLLAVQDDSRTLAFARRADLAQLLEQGPATPQHAVFIKRLPMMGPDVAAYAAAYRAYAGAIAGKRFDSGVVAGNKSDPGVIAGNRSDPVAIATNRSDSDVMDGNSTDAGAMARNSTDPDVATGHSTHTGHSESAPDPAPRVVLDPAYGALVAGYGTETLGMACDIFRHGRAIMTRAAAHDRYRGLPPAAILEAEIHYGGFERRLRQANASKDRLRGLCVGVALAQDNAALATALADHGAAVVDASTDTARDIVARYGGLDGIVCDVHHGGRLGGLHDLLDLAPYGGQQLEASLGIDELIARLTPP